MEKPIIATIEKSVDEAEEIRTIFIQHTIQAKPGQFVMVWVPRLNEKPFAISYLEKDVLGITVAAVGECSRRLYEMKPGEKIGIRGPYGEPYHLQENQEKDHIKDRMVVMVGGGYGSASLTLLAEEALAKGMHVKFILGAREKKRLVYVERIKKLIGEENLLITTDDGSAGKKGFVTDALRTLIEQGEKIGKVYACGPDKMMKAVAELCTAHNIQGEISMERWMKCGFGLCGHCCVDPLGFRVCVEGHVVSFETALQVKELGTYHRMQSSRKEKL